MNIRPALVMALIAASTVGCGDPGVGFYATNSSSELVIVQFTTDDGVSTLEGYSVPPKAYGNTWTALGVSTWKAVVRVLDTECRLLWDDEIDAGSGGVVIASDGVVAWSSAPPVWPAQDDPRPAIKETTKCNVGQD